MNSVCETSDLLVFSHLRWDFVFQRPQHLLSRHARYRRVYYFEEPVLGMTEVPRLHLKETQEGVQVVVPYLPPDIRPEYVEASLKDLVNELIFEEDLSKYTLWFYTPKALPISRHLAPEAVIYDCIEHAPANLLEYETELMEKADIVFTGGQTLYETKKTFHHNIHHCPSSIDYGHFSQARLQLVEPEDQINIPRPRIGFYGVIDDRFDLDLLEQMAQKKPEYQFVVVGPVVKIDSKTLPQRHNIFYLGKKDYHALPLYLAGWDCAMMPFALNDSTKYISPNKTPEFLAAGRPVVSTPIRDVVFPYGEKKLVHIASSADEFLVCIERAMEERCANPEWVNRIDSFLLTNSWDNTFMKMAKLESELRKRAIQDRLKPALNPAPISISGVF